MIHISTYLTVLLNGHTLICVQKITCFLTGVPISKEHHLEVYIISICSSKSYEAFLFDDRCLYLVPFEPQVQSQLQEHWLLTCIK